MWSLWWDKTHQGRLLQTHRLPEVVGGTTKKEGCHQGIGEPDPGDKALLAAAGPIGGEEDGGLYGMHRDTGTKTTKRREKPTVAMRKENTESAVGKEKGQNENLPKIGFYREVTWSQTLSLI